MSIKEIKRPEALNIDEFGALHEGIALQNLNQLCHVSYREEDRTFTSQAWNMLFRIHERVVREYVMEFLSSFTFRDHIVDLDNADTMVFQLGGVKRSMIMRQFILALGLYTPEEMGNVGTVHVAKFFTDKAKGYKKKSPIVGAHLIRGLLSICRYNGLGYGELVDDIPDNDENEGVADASHDDERGVRCHPI
ncbi:hypothetical protein Tco_0677504 [Tanacetum coccineum]|uniref:Uncharacterized protein n=1 Tax=Tanacetum coccineum TaxID=301880 RepID=A0ABQ4XCD5_9ASTR